MSQPTQDLRITGVRPLIPPAILIEELPITEQVSKLVADTRAAVAAVVEQRDPRLVVVVGPCSIHDPAAAVEYASRLRPLRGSLRARIGGRDALLLREAPHDRRLEGPDQRSRSRRQLPRQPRAATGPEAAPRREQPRFADGLGVPRYADPAVHRRPHVLGGDRGTHNREPGPPRDGVRAVDARRLQEQHRRQRPDCHRRSASYRRRSTGSPASPSRAFQQSSTPPGTGPATSSCAGDRRRAPTTTRHTSRPSRSDCRSAAARPPS